MRGHLFSRRPNCTKREREREMKECELCRNPASMYCESDQACLCWDCDEKVHRANFLVVKHSRTLLCHVCQSPTPWKASGPKLGPTVSVCDTCLRDGKPEETVSDAARREGGHEDRDREEDDLEGEYSETDDDGENADDDDDDDEAENGENQVVPWSSTPSPPPVVVNSSITAFSEESGSSLFSAGGSAHGGGDSSFKRPRRFEDFDSQDESGCSSPVLNDNVTLMSMNNQASEKDGTTSMRPFRPLKVRRTKPDNYATEKGRENFKSDNCN